MPGPDPDGPDATDSNSSSSSRKSKTKDSLRGAGSALSSYASQESDRASDIAQSIRPVSYKRGGTVKRTGLARVHKGELVIPRGKVKRAKKAMRKAGRKSSGR